MTMKDEDIFEQSRIADIYLRSKMYSLMSQIAVFGQLNLNNGEIYWLIVEEIEDEEGENPNCMLGIKYKDNTDNSYWPITSDNLKNIELLAVKNNYDLRVAVPREMKKGYVLILQPR